MEDEDSHRPVLVDELLEALQPVSGGCYVDCTFGRGGHARALLSRIGPAGRVLVMDKDPQAADEARRLAAADPRVRALHADFRDLDRIADEAGLMGEVHGVVLDLGVSSPQLDDPRRGFSFREDGPLDMRMDPACGESATHWINRASEREICRVIGEYGEDRDARRIARAIVRAREDGPIERTRQLAAVVAGASRVRAGRGPRRHPATRTFQAIRIHVNAELDALSAVLVRAVRVLRVGGRLAVISFHSLEDRVVKRFVQAHARPDPHTRAPVTLRIVERLVRAGEVEVRANPRARSALLRVAEKLA